MSLGDWLTISFTLAHTLSEGHPGATEENSDIWRGYDVELVELPVATSWSGESVATAIANIAAIATWLAIAPLTPAWACAGLESGVIYHFGNIVLGATDHFWAFSLPLDNSNATDDKA